MPLRTPLLVTALLFGACATSTPSEDAAAVDDGGRTSIDSGDAHDIDAAGHDAGALPPQTARLRIVNRCGGDLWIAHSSNVPGAQNVRLAPGAFHDYALPDGELSAARFWPKTGCDATGHACRVGDNGEGGGAPCGPTGCAPPFDSKFEATFAAIGSSAQTWYNLSFVDGYTLPITVRPIGPGTNQGTCVTSDCSGLTLDACPAAESLGDGTTVDLRVRDPADPSRTIACLAPCKAWNYPAPYGLGEPESEDPGLHMCCPTPIDPASGQCTIANGCLTPEACRAPGDPLSVVHTSYVGLIHDRCPSAYGYSYDDEAGLHACPSTTMFEVTFCP